MCVCVFFKDLSWDLSVVEEVTAHQLWELKTGWIAAALPCSTPRPRVLRALQENTLLARGCELALLAMT